MSEFPKPGFEEIERPKSPELRYAQAEAYAETVEDLREQGGLVLALEECAALGSLEQLDDLSPALRSLIERHRQPYTEFLRSQRGREGFNADLEERIEYYRKYQEFRPEVRRLQAQVDQIAQVVDSETRDSSKEVGDPLYKLRSQVEQLPEFVEMTTRNVVFRMGASEGGGIGQVPDGARSPELSE